MHVGKDGAFDKYVLVKNYQGSEQKRLAVSSLKLQLDRDFSPALQQSIQAFPGCYRCEVCCWDLQFEIETLKSCWYPSLGKRNTAELLGSWCWRGTSEVRVCLPLNQHPVFLLHPPHLGDLQYCRLAAVLELTSLLPEPAAAVLWHLQLLLQKDSACLKAESAELHKGGSATSSLTPDGEILWQQKLTAYLCLPPAHQKWFFSHVQQTAPIHPCSHAVDRFCTGPNCCESPTVPSRQTLGHPLTVAVHSWGAVYPAWLLCQQVSPWRCCCWCRSSLEGVLPLG